MRRGMHAQEIYAQGLASTTAAATVYSRSQRYVPHTRHPTCRIHEQTGAIHNAEDRQEHSMRSRCRDSTNTRCSPGVPALSSLLHLQATSLGRNQQVQKNLCFHLVLLGTSTGRLVLSVTSVQERAFLFQFSAAQPGALGLGARGVG